MSLFSETQQEATTDRQEEYLRAQQAGAEAVEIGRETLAAVVHQGEQLQRAGKMVDETMYITDHGTRLLKGMTWSGWLSNKFSKPLESPEYKNKNDENDTKKSLLRPLKAYESIPDSCLPASQAVQNYHLNLQVLEDCETEDQKKTCKFICDDMHRQAKIKVTDLLRGSNSIESSDEMKDFALQLQEDLSYLRQRQLVLQKVSREEPTTNSATNVDDVKTNLFEGTAKQKAKGTDALLANDNEYAEQEQHLDILSQQCQELGLLASNIGISAEQQAEIVESLDNKNDTLHFKMNLMNRRTEQLIKDKSWGKVKAQFSHYVTIKHSASGKYLAIDINNDTTLVLSTKLNERCVFGVYKRRMFVGLQSKFSRKWMGHNLLGQLSCGATAFNRRQEWEIGGEDWTDATLLVVSAGWGNGGYLLLDDNALPIIGAGDMVTKGQAPKWNISEFEDPRA
eukprot:CAMPEP_0116133068 /NCGR_PEP_ID=MMETSP0329-20121206/9904_1 /TAXON_ID=697910 /ORGANISM="Pseudo-nitzschia arenysensis, Strain B593" /LENGTH=452 /DNA_ID=CAMNT_0003627665 /DNA_START=106 /DNA_END=1464 /DNA_ORIENTATION=+